MKRAILGFILAAAALCAPLTSRAGDPVYGDVVPQQAFAVDAYAIVDLRGYDRFSAQAVYFSSTPAAVTLSDGAYGYAHLYIPSTTTLLGKSVSIAGTSVNLATAATTVIASTATAATLRANVTLAALFNFSTTTFSGTSVVTATRTAVGFDTSALVSNTTSAYWINPNVVGGKPSDIDPATDLVTTLAKHGFVTGQAVLFATVSGTAPTGLTTGTTYYVAKVNDNQFAFATTTTTAVAGTKINITALTGSGSFTVTPLAFSAISGTSNNTGLKWQASNDNATWTDLTATQFNITVASVTYTTGSTTPASTQWDFGAIGFRFLRLVIRAPNGAGALAVKVVGYALRYN